MMDGRDIVNGRTTEERWGLPLSNRDRGDVVAALTLVSTFHYIPTPQWS